MKIKWPEPYPGAYWLDAQEDRAVLDVLHQRSLFRYYGLHKPNYTLALEKTARQFYGVKHALGVNSGTVSGAVRGINDDLALGTELQLSAADGGGAAAHSTNG